MKAKIISKTTKAKHTATACDRRAEKWEHWIEIEWNIHKIRNTELNIEHWKLLNKQPFNLNNLQFDIYERNTITIGSKPSKVDLLNKNKWNTQKSDQNIYLCLSKIRNSLDSYNHIEWWNMKCAKMYVQFRLGNG